MERVVWLFTRGDESIRIMRKAGGTVLFVFGPRYASITHTFDNPESLEAFLPSYLRDLEEDEWTLHATVDRRRSEEPPPPPGGDRRRSQQPD
jgi:hypothetical protein